MKYKIRKGLIFEKKGKKITLFDPGKSTIISLNKTGGFILSQIEKGLDENNVLDNLVKKYGQTKTRLRKDMTMFLKELKKLEIIT